MLRFLPTRTCATNSLGFPTTTLDERRPAWCRELPLGRRGGKEEEEKVMPCGGIYPVNLSDLLLPGAQPQCFVCGDNYPDRSGKPNYVYFCEEWDCWIHRECIHKFLTLEEGRCVLAHRHSIFIQGEEKEVAGG